MIWMAHHVLNVSAQRGDVEVQVVLQGASARGAEPLARINDEPRYCSC